MYVEGLGVSWGTHDDLGSRASKSLTENTRSVHIENQGDQCCLRHLQECHFWKSPKRQCDERVNLEKKRVEGWANE